MLRDVEGAPWSRGDISVTDKEHIQTHTQTKDPNRSVFVDVKRTKGVRKVPACEQIFYWGANYFIEELRKIYPGFQTLLSRKSSRRGSRPSATSIVCYNVYVVADDITSRRFIYEPTI